MANRVGLIQQLAEKWLETAIIQAGVSKWVTAPAQGRIEITEASEQYRLLANGLAPEALDYEEVQAAYLALTRVLLLPGLNVVVAQDHIFYWAWAAEILVGQGGSLGGPPHIRELCDAAMRIALAAHSQRTLATITEWHLREVVGRYRFTLLSCVAFPLLEGLLRARCGSYVNDQWKVISKFTALKRNGKPDLYEPPRFCNSLAALLFLFNNHVAAPDLRVALTDVRSHLQQFEPTLDPYHILYEWRNGLLHGGPSATTVAGTILNLAILIALADIKDHYDQLRQAAVQRAAAGQDTPWTFYPPR